MLDITLYLQCIHTTIVHGTIVPSVHYTIWHSYTLTIKLDMYYT